MTATATSRALELPEIVYRIGWFIPIWRQTSTYMTSVLHAKDLLSCLQVNWLWKTTLTPLLWTLCVLRKNREIPEAEIQANKHHICYMYFLGYVAPTQDFHIMQLKELTLPELHEISDCTRLLLSNPNLQYLSLSAHINRKPKIENERFNHFLQALQALTKLENLNMGIMENFEFCEKFDTTLLRTILSKNHGLKEFFIYFYHPLARCDGWEPLPWIEKLHLNTTKLENGAIQLLQHCPNITSLVLTLYSDCPWDDVYLAMGGAGGRAKLTNLKFLNPHRNAYDSDVNDPSNYKALRILETTTALVTLKWFFNVSVVESCQDIIDNCSNTLQYLTLHIDEASMDTVSSVNKILRNCPELRRLSVHGDHFSQLWFRLFEPRWDVPKLESLKIKMNVKKRVIDYAGDNYDLGDLCYLDMGAWRLKNFLYALEGIMKSNSQSFVAGSESGTEQNIYDEGSKVGLDKPTVDILIGVFEQYYERERQLIASIKDNGWRVSSNHNILDNNLDLQRFRGFLLETAMTIPSLRTVRLNSTVFDRV
ncbi:hypothetical protein BGZ94_008397 [Podila epigama]|nr:hypothetical protein BGZ94_008397 [Podila epigama]